MQKSEEKSEKSKTLQMLQPLPNQANLEPILLYPFMEILLGIFIYTNVTYPDAVD